MLYLSSFFQFPDPFTPGTGLSVSHDVGIYDTTTFEFTDAGISGKRADNRPGLQNA